MVKLTVLLKGAGFIIAVGWLGVALFFNSANCFSFQKGNIKPPLVPPGFEKEM